MKKKTEPTCVGNIKLYKEIRHLSLICCCLFIYILYIDNYLSILTKCFC